MLTMNTIPPNNIIKSLYFELVAEIDKEVQRISELFPKGSIQCKPGCFECCINFSVFPLEAALVNERLSEQINRVSTKEDLCRLLKNERCSVYEVRPIICRTQGIPLGYIHEDSGAIEVSSCNLNFPQDHEFAEEQILFMDKFNNRLSSLNQQYCLKIDRDPFKRVPLSWLIR